LCFGFNLGQELGQQQQKQQREEKARVEILRFMNLFAFIRLFPTRIPVMKGK